MMDITYEPNEPFLLKLLLVTVFCHSNRNPKLRQSHLSLCGDGSRSQDEGPHTVHLLSQFAEIKVSINDH